MRETTIKVKVPSWVTDEEIERAVMEAISSLSYVPIDVIRKKLGITELTDEITIEIDVKELRDREKRRLSPS